MFPGKKILYHSTLAVLLLFFVFAGLIYAKPFLAPFSLATILALLVLPLSKKMESSLMKRTWASLVNTFLLFVLSIGFFALFSMQVKQLMDDWPKIKQTMAPKVDQFKGFVYEHTPFKENITQSSKGSQSLSFLSGGKKSGEKAGGILKKAISFIGTYLLTFVYIFFILAYRRHFKKFLLRLFPTEKRNSVENVIGEAANVAQKYLLGKLMLTGFLAAFYAIGLGLSGVKNFILISVISAIFSIIPYIGNLLGFGLAMVLGYLSSGSTTGLIGITLTFSIGQFIETYFMEPYIVGDKVDLHPFITILAVVIGNFVWGMIGMILAIPILAIVNIVFIHVSALRPLGYLLSKEGKVG